MGIEQALDGVAETDMEANCRHTLIATATQAALTDRAQMPDIVSGLDADLRTYHENLPRATAKKVNLAVSQGKRQAALGCLTQVVLDNLLEQAVPLIEARSFLVEAGLPGSRFYESEDPKSNHTPIIRSVSGSSERFLLATMGWLQRGAESVLIRGENPDDKNHPIWAANQAIHIEYCKAQKAYSRELSADFRKSLAEIDEATAITTGQLLIARAVSYSRSQTTYPTGLELTRSALQAADQLSWMVGGKRNLAFKYLHAVNWIGKFSAFEAAEQMSAAPELFTGTPELFDTDAVMQWQLGALRKGPLPRDERGYCPLDVLDEDMPHQANATQIVEDFIGTVEDRYELTIPRDKNNTLPGSTVYIVFGSLLGAETIHAAWQPAMQRNAAM